MTEDMITDFATGYEWRIRCEQQDGFVHVSMDRQDKLRVLFDFRDGWIRNVQTERKVLNRQRVYTTEQEDHSELVEDVSDYVVQQAKNVWAQWCAQQHVQPENNELPIARGTIEAAIADQVNRVTTAISMREENE